VISASCNSFGLDRFEGESNGWRRFDGGAERAELYEMATSDRRDALQLARQNAGKLILSRTRPLTAEQEKERENAQARAQLKALGL
jgi:hypothetical protein